MKDQGMDGTATEEKFTRVRGMRYLEFLRGVHAAMQPQWYLEIGTNRGNSIVLADCAAIVIDPQFRLSADVIGKKPELHMFQMTSDDAFACDRLKKLGIRIDMAFLDGLHVAEFLLRDFMNTEAMMADDGVIFMHDTAPFDHVMTNREFLRGIPASTGDVWKILPILKEYRPELEILHLDCKPTGLTMIRGPWRKSNALKKNYAEILERFVPMDLMGFGVNRFYADFAPVSAKFTLEGMTG